MIANDVLSTGVREGPSLTETWVKKKVSPTDIWGRAFQGSIRHVDRMSLET